MLRLEMSEGNFSRSIASSSHFDLHLGQLLEALISVVLATKLLTTLLTRIEMQKAKNATTT